MRKVDELEEEASRLRRKKRQILAAAALLIIGVCVYGWVDAVLAPPPVVTPQRTDVGGSGRKAPEDIVVYVSGMVEHPGVVKVSGGSRALDAVNAAGGLLPGAEVSGLNLAQRLRDGMQIHVPGRPVIKDEGSSPQYQPVAGAARNSSPPAGAPVPAAKVNINTATAAELDQLPGIGPAMAARIVEWRQANGPFQSGEDLKKVQGIGEAKYRKLKDKITW